MKTPLVVGSRQVGVGASRSGIQASQHAYVLMPGAFPVGLPRAECFVVVYKEEY